MRSRYITFRVSDAEYQILKTQAGAAGTSVPVLARGLAIESVQLTPRLDNLERLMRDIPDRAGMVAALEKLGARISALQALAAKIDAATTKKGATP